MRTALLLCASLLSVPAFASDDLVARQGADTVRLADEPCTSKQVLSQLEPGVQVDLKKASAEVGGQTFQACWRVMGSTAHVVYEDGDQGLIPLADFKAELSA